MNLQDFTDEQQLAIKTVDNNLLVSASAGSGKTSVLVTRVCYLLEQKLASLNELLVVTFTNLASLEMKARVKSNLENLSKTDLYFKSQLDLISTSDISTLHKFCQKLIKEYFYSVSLDPNFEILDEGKSDYILNEILDNLIDKELKTNKDFLYLMMQFNDSRTDVKFRECSLKALKYLKSKQNYVDFCNKVISLSYSDDLEKNIVIQYLNNYIDSFLSYFNKIFVEFKLNAEMIESTKLFEINDFYINLISTISKCSIENKILMLTAKIDYPILSVPRNARSEEVELKEQMASSINLFKDEIFSIAEILVFDNVKSIRDNINNVAKKLKSFIEFVLKLDKTYQNQKKEQKVLDFSDLEHYALEILQNEKIRKVIQNRYKYIFIDEYQDTNEIQEKIISLVSKGDNLFMVGDMKQSIYGFRECMPEILNSKFNNYKNNENLGKAIKLNKNFRSEIDILNFSNFLFSKIMRTDSVNLDYSNDASFIYGGKNNSSSEISIFVKVLNSEKPIEQPLEKMYNKFTAKLDTNENASIIKESKFVASEIRKLIGQEIYDAKKQVMKKITYKDIAILTRKNANVVNFLTDVLRDYNIPFSAEISSFIFKSYENAVIFNLLKLINNLDDDIALSSVLCSFMYKLSHQNLYDIKKQDCSMLESIKEYVKLSDDEISKLLKKFILDIEMFRTYFACNDLAECFYKILNFYDVNLYLESLKNEEKISSLKLFEENIKTFNYLSLNEYINFITNGQIDKMTNSQVSSIGDSVSILTIHGSKGLEFPVVFLINAGSNFSNKSAVSKLVTNQDFGFAIKEFDEFNQVEQASVIKNIFNLNNRQKETAEEMRLLYVALTRAKNKLYTVGTMSVDKMKQLNGSFEIMKVRNYLGWITGSLSENQIIQLQQNQTINVKYENSNFEFQVIDNENTNDNESHLSYSSNMLLSNEDINYLSSTKEPSNLMLKNTVTAIMNAENENEDYNISDFVYNPKKDDDNDFLLIGNLYHLVMEKIDINEIESQQNVEEFLSTLVTNNLVNNEQIKLVDSEKIFKCCEFLKSIISEGDIVLKEKSFMMYENAKKLVNTDDDSKVLVQGTVDICIIKSDEILLIDYKTTKAKSEEFLTNHYYKQMSLYSKALSDFYNKPVYKKFIYSFYFDKPLIV